MYYTMKKIAIIIVYFCNDVVYVICMKFALFCLLHSILAAPFDSKVNIYPFKWILNQIKRTRSNVK